ncbi:MAG: hypothetical protein ABEJ58_04670 [Halodesulfurarchaeum sp.]
MKQVVATENSQMQVLDSVVYPRREKEAGSKNDPAAALNWSPLTLRPSKRSVI